MGISRNIKNCFVLKKNINQNIWNIGFDLPGVAGVVYLLGGCPRLVVGQVHQVVVTAQLLEQQH